MPQARTQHALDVFQHAMHILYQASIYPDISPVNMWLWAVVSDRPGECSTAQAMSAAPSCAEPGARS